MAPYPPQAMRYLTDTRGAGGLDAPDVTGVMVVQSDGTKRLLSSTLDIVKSAWLRAMGRD